MRTLLKLLNIHVLQMYSDKGKNCKRICYCVQDLTQAQITILERVGCVVTEAVYNKFGVKVNNYDYYIRWRRV